MARQDNERPCNSPRRLTNCGWRLETEGLKKRQCPISCSRAAFIEADFGRCDLVVLCSSSAHSVPGSAKGSEAAHRVLQNLSTAVQSLAELRNQLGIGHGREKLSPAFARHARLASTPPEPWSNSCWRLGTSAELHPARKRRLLPPRRLPGSARDRRCEPFPK
jgi:Abortive infection C-terminus